MIFKDTEEVKRHIKIGIPLPCYFISGSDDYRRLTIQKKLAAISVEKGNDFDIHRFSGNVSADTLADAAFEITFGGGRRCIVAEDIPLNSIGDNEYKKFEELVKEISETPDGSVLIFSFGAIDTEPKKDEKKRDRFTPFKKLIDKCGGGIIKCDSPSSAELCSMIESAAGKLHCKIDRDLCFYMVERCGNDSARLLNEIKKVAEYHGSGDIRKQDIDLMTCPTPDARIYDVAAKIAAKDRDGAFEVINELRELGEKPPVILNVLSGTFVDMLRAKTARSSGKTKQDILKDWHKSYARRDFVIDKAMSLQSRYSNAELLRCLDILLGGEQKMKSIAADENIVLDETVAEIFAVR